MPHTRRSAVALRHVAFEDLGLLGPILAREGFDIAFREAAIDDLGDGAIESADLLVVLGGPIGVYETESYPFITREIALLERRLGRGLPTLGICLGAQLMAKALGSRVYPGAVKEIGWGPVRLSDAGAASCLASLGSDGPVLHWHGDTFDLPAAASRLASNANYENQAFVHGDNALALQFHLEAEPRRLENWFVGHAAELAGAKISVPELRATTSRLADVVTAQADRVFADWLRRISQHDAAAQASVGARR